MKRFLFLMLTFIGMMAVNVQAQMASDAFVKIEDHDMFSRCFAECDSDGDGFVTYEEAAKATKLVLDFGGRLNIIEDFGFLTHFPNLTMLSVGNTSVEHIDLRCCPKLKHLNLTNGLWVKDVTLAVGCSPQIIFPAGSADVMIHRSDKPCERAGFSYRERMEHELFPCYLVSTDGKKYGVYNNGKLVVPCQYTKLEALRNWQVMKRANKQKK
ncbi:MAG: hypothetical protein IKR18_03095 [Bacteroidaceae bacterium]|nr:hypothetical protein [Bacteroidaceae bacterium]